jgi:hypothetical protein
MTMLVEVAPSPVPGPMTPARRRRRPPDWARMFVAGAVLWVATVVW